MAQNSHSVSFYFVTGLLVIIITLVLPGSGKKEKYDKPLRALGGFLGLCHFLLV